MDIKVYANEELKAGWKAKGISTDEVKEELRKTMRVLAGLEKSGDLNGDSTRDVGDIVDRIEKIEIQIEEWKETM
tara:strand:+ start:53 stop:277 length:225 start_codon:yes stop_codon:yes gene_type:complete